MRYSTVPPERSSRLLSAQDAFLGAAAARLNALIPGSLVSSAGPRALPLPARCGTHFASRPRNLSGAAAPSVLISPRGTGLLLEADRRRKH
jgi:hypothetical protein